MGFFADVSHFIPCNKNLDTRHFAILFLKEIVRLRGIPKDVITDRGSLFTSDLSKKTKEKLGIDRRLSTVFDQQKDGQT